MTQMSALHQQIEEAVEPVSQFWPMKGFVSHNPLQGLEHLPFDEAIREAKHLFGAEGYLPIEEYRGCYESGRIKERSVDRALARVGPKNEASISLASRTISAAEVQRIHLLHGVDVLEPASFGEACCLHSIWSIRALSRTTTTPMTATPRKSSCRSAARSATGSTN
jgi:hypothetical protein